jgi:hypothetical protein
MTDAEYERLKKTLKEETQRREDLAKNESVLTDVQKEKIRLQSHGMQGLNVYLTLGNSCESFSFRITDYNLVQSFLDNYEDLLALKIKQQRKALGK